MSKSTRWNIAKRTLSLILALTMLFSLPVTTAFATDDQNADSSGMVVTQDGAANAGIVVPADASDMEKYAAEELQYHVQKVSGATLPISSEIGGFTASFVTDSITAESSGYYPVELTLQNPTDETYEVTIQQEAVTNGMPALTVRGTEDIGGTVTVAPKTEVHVSGVVYVEDVFTFTEYPLSVKFLVGENELATDTLNIINGIAAANLVKNGGFETVNPDNGAWAFSPWWLPEDCFEIETADVHSGSYAAKLKGITEIYGYDAYIQANANTTYTVSFWAKGAGASFSVIINEHISSEVWSGKAYNTFQLTGDWAKYQFTFTTYADEAPEYRGIWMNLGVAGGTVLLDDFVFMETPAGSVPDEPEQDTPKQDESSQPSAEAEIVNLVSNGNFETVNLEGAEYTFSPWWLPTDCFTVETEDVHGGSYAVKLKGITEIYGYDSWVKTKPGTAYTVSFWAKGAGASFTVKTSGTDTGRATFLLTDEWAQYQVTLNTLASEDPGYNGIWMNLGVAGGTVLLDDFIFMETPEQPEIVNLVSNGNFETVNPDGAEYTFSPWWLPTDCFTVETADVHGGSYAVKLTGATEIYGYDSWVKTKPGTAYTVSFWAKGAGASFTVKTSGTDTARATFQLTDNWALYQFNLTTAASDDPAYNGIWMNLGVAGGTVLLDDFIFMEAPAEIVLEPEQDEPSQPSDETEVVNLVTNGDFETVNPAGAEYTFSPWWLPTDCFTVETEDVHGGSYAVKLTGATEIYGYDSWVKTTPSTAYTVSFWAKGAGASFTVKTSGTDTARATFQLTDSWAQYQFTLTTQAAEDASTYNGIWMNLGVAGGTVLLDDFVFAEASEEPAPEDPETPELPEIAAPVASDFAINATIIVATPDSYPELNDLFADDIAWLEDIGEPGDDERYGDDGFAIRKIGDIIYIFGTTARGALNGVYDFIEENMGVLWTRADEDLGLIYEEMPTITASKVDYREKSPFAMRGWHLCGTGSNSEFHSDPATEIMMARNKLNAKLAEPGNSGSWDWQTSIGITPFHLTHNVSSWILNSPSYDPDYLEYWNTDESGNHYVPGGEGWNPSAHQINFWDQGADGKTLQTVIDSVLKFLNDNPDAKYVGVGIEDTYSCTQVPEQSADFEYATGKFVSPTDDNYLSTVTFSFINKVAKAVAAQHPDVMVNAYAYFFAEIPPACDIEDNVCVVFAPINEDVTDTLDTQEDSPNKVYLEQLNEWAAKTSNVVTYNYYGCFRPSAYYERPIADKIQDDMQFYASNGFTGLMPEGLVDAGTSEDTWAMNALTFWLYSKLAWNPNEDLDALIQEFCDKSYGDASEYMREYYDYVKQGWENGKEGVNIRWDSNLNVYLDAFVRECGFIDEMQAALDNAWNAANDIEKERIRHIKETFEENIQSLSVVEETGSAARTDAGKAAVLATIDLDDPFADEIWADAQVLERFLYHATAKPIDGVDMKVRLLWDDTYLYVGYENFDITIDDMPVADLAGTWWNGACTDVETFIAAELDGTLYDYFTNPRSAHFRYYRESGGGATFDTAEVNWDATAKVFDVDDVNQDRWIAIQAISFESIGITDPITAETEIYATFFRDLGTGNSLGWNAASVWDTAYLDPITLLGAPDISDEASASVYGHSLTLNDSIGVDFYLDLSNAIATDETAYVEFTLPDMKKTKVKVDITEQMKTTIDGNTYFKVSCEVAAKEMTGTIYAQVVANNGNWTSDVFTYDVQTYAVKILENPAAYETTEEKQNQLAVLVKAMLNYGAAAQVQFGYNLDNLANSILDEADKAVKPLSDSDLASYAAAAGTGIDNARCVAASLMLESKTGLRLYFNVAEGAAVTFAYNGNPLEYVPDSGYGYTGYVEIAGIVAKSLDDWYEVTVTDGTNSATVKHSPLKYCYNVVKGDYPANLDHMVAALYAYNQAAGNYLES